MLSGKAAADTARGEKNAFWNTLEELHRYFDRIDILTPVTALLFGNVYFHPELEPGQRFDVMTVQEYFPFRNGRLAEHIWHATRMPYLLEIHHVPGYPRAANLREWIARVATQAYIARDARHAAAVRVVNRKQTPEFLIRAGVPAEKIRYIPSMYIDLEIFKPMNLEKKHDLLLVGRHAANKGIDLFIQTARKLKAKSLIVDGWVRDAHELARIYNQSRLLVVPSYNEGGPRVMLEALACGTPVLSTRVGLAPELLGNDHLTDWSVDDMVRKARVLLDHPSAIPSIPPEFEKKTAIKNYAQNILQLVH